MVEYGDAGNCDRMFHSVAKRETYAKKAAVRRGLDSTDRAGGTDRCAANRNRRDHFVRS